MASLRDHLNYVVAKRDTDRELVDSILTVTRNHHAAEIRQLQEKLAAAREGMAAYKDHELHLFDVHVHGDTRCPGCEAAAENLNGDLCCEPYRQQTEVIARAWRASA